MGDTARFTAPISAMIEPDTKDAYLKRAAELRRPYAVLIRKALSAYLASLPDDDGKE